MAEVRPLPTRVSIVGLEAPLAGELRKVLEANGCEVECSDVARKVKADLVFCSSDLPFFQKVFRLNPNRPIVVVSRIPEVSGWLDALEAGATDYCAAPFESIQVCWLLKTHLRSRRSFAAA